MGAMHVLTLDLAPVTPKDAPLLHRVFHLSPSYFALIGMELPTLEDVVRDLQTLEVDPRRRAFLLFLGQEPVGYLDAKLGYPEAEDATLSLLLIREDHQGRGLGRQALERFAAGLGADPYLVRSAPLTPPPAGLRQHRGPSKRWRLLWGHPGKGRHAPPGAFRAGRLL